MKRIGLAVVVVMTRLAAAAPAPDPAAPDPAAPDPAAPSPEPRFAPPSLAPLVQPAVTETDQPPPLDAGRMVGEVALGTGVGFVGFALGAFAGAGLECAGGCPGEFGGLGGAIIGGAIGGVLGIGTGVYLVGSAREQTGSFGATIGGAVLGAGAGGLVWAAMAGANRQLEGAGAVVFLASPIAGALIGFNLTRRWDRPARAPAIGSLLRLDRGNLRAGIPLVLPGSSGSSILSIASGSF